MSAEPRRLGGARVADVKIVTSHVPRPVAAPSTWRTWVLLLERPDPEEWPAWPAGEGEADTSAF